MIHKLILERRTICKFNQKKIPRNILFDSINAARLAPSSANAQPLEYIIVTKTIDKIFACTHWAGYLENGAPKENERLVAYIIIISNTKINSDAKYDAGLAQQGILSLLR